MSKALWTQLPGAVPVPGPVKVITRKLQYREDAHNFTRNLRLEGKTCPVVAVIPELRNGFRYGHPISNKITEVHHVYGRRAKLLLWQPGWKGVSKEGHRFIHQHIEIARQHGWIGPVGTWNDFERAKAHQFT